MKKTSLGFLAGASLLLSLLSTTAIAENTVYAPPELTVKIIGDKVVGVRGGRFRATTEIREIIVSGGAYFECQNTPNDLIHKTRSVLTTWVGQDVPKKKWSEWLEYRGKNQDTGCSPEQERCYNSISDLGPFSVDGLVAKCQTQPEGEKNNLSFNAPISLTSVCIAREKGTDVELLDPTTWGMEFLGSDTWLESNDAPLRINLECDRTRIATTKKSQTSDGKWRHCCKSQWAVAGTHNSCVTTSSEGTKLCVQMVRAEETKPLGGSDAVPYVYRCPEGYYLRYTNEQNKSSYERLPGDDQWCFPSPANSGNRG